jgi:hypothetical protein
LNELVIKHHTKKIVLLGWGTEEEIRLQSGIKNSMHIIGCMSLSAEKIIDEVAKNLFATMRKADTFGADVILIHPFPNQGIGMAVNDRLQRAQVHD